jgi:hypothetical protein
MGASRTLLTVIASAAVAASCGTPPGPVTSPPAATGGATPTTAATATATPQPTGLRVVLRAPEGVAVDHVGNVFVSDFLGEVIVKIPPGGALEPFAGTGQAGLADAGSALPLAMFREPSGLAWGLAGELYVADHHNQRVWRIANQQLQLVAGSGATGQGAGGFGGDGSAATDALLNEPLGLVAALKALYIGDSFNSRVRVVAADGTIHTVLGGGTTPIGQTPIQGTDASAGILGYLALDSRGNLYVSERSGSPGPPGGARILRLAHDGTVTVFAGTGRPGFSGDGGPATGAQLSDPNGLAFDFAGNLLVCDSGNRRIRRITPDGVISTFAGTGADNPATVGSDAATSSIGSCYGLAIDPAGAIWLADGDNGRIVALDPSGRVTAVFGGT